MNRIKIYLPCILDSKENDKSPHQLSTIIFKLCIYNHVTINKKFKCITGKNIYTWIFIVYRRLADSPSFVEVPLCILERQMPNMHQSIMIGQANITKHQRWVTMTTSTTSRSRMTIRHDNGVGKGTEWPWGSNTSTVITRRRTTTRN